MSDTDPTDPTDPALLAGEFVLGVLDAGEMARVRESARRDPALAAEIRAWERRLIPIATALPSLAPPRALWDRLEEAIAPLPLDPANDPGLPATTTARRRGVGWPAATAVSLALAAGFAALALLPVLSPRPLAPPPQLAAIAPLNAPAPAFLAQAAADGTVQLAAVAPAVVPPGKDYELWLLRPGETAPAPIGVFPATGAAVRLPGRPASGSQLFISLEPAGGSPNGKPTTVLYGGTLTSL